MGVKISELTELGTVSDNDVLPIVDVANEGTKKIKIKTIKEFILDISHPIGSTYVTQTNTNPSTILGFGTWERFKALVALGLDENDTDFNTIGKTGGEKEHTLTISEMPSHRHSMWARNYNVQSTTGGNVAGNANEEMGQYDNTYAGGGQAHNNVQPYEVVGYMWIRRS